MVNTTFSKTLVASTLVGAVAFGSAANAGADGGLHSWSTAAGKSVSGEMTYPAMAVRYGKEGAPAFRVTVDRNGDILSLDQTKTSRSGIINGAAKKALSRVDFPSLPQGFAGDKLTFAVKLNYALAYSVKEQRHLQREGRVSSRRIASGTAPMSASVEVVDNMAD